MATRAPSRRWLLRDMPRTFVVLVWIAFSASVVFFFSDWPSLRREAAVNPPSHNVDNVTKDSDKRYVGSIVIVSERGDRCLEFKLDNRTGKMWDMGLVNCDEVVSPPEDSRPSRAISVLRMDAIGKAFNKYRN